MTATQVMAKDLHAGDWIKCPRGITHACWIGTRRSEGDSVRFTIGRGHGHIHTDVVMKATESITLLARWPEMPAGTK